METSTKARIAAVAIGASLVSITGVALIKSHEGLRTTAYPDPGTGGAPWTICYGHTKGVKPGMRATEAQCEQWLKEDMLEAEAYLRKSVSVPLTQGEYDAYTSFIFNAGPTNWHNSTMRRLLNQGKRIDACNQFPRWIYANKRVLNGLKVRRYDEQRQCLSFGRYVYERK